MPRLGIEPISWTCARQIAERSRRETLQSERDEAMAEQLTEHVHRADDGRLWQRYDRLDRQGRPAEPAYHPLHTEPAVELAQALLTERKRVERLRAELERQADYWEAEAEYYTDAPELRRNRINRAQAIRQAIREDGEGRDG